MKNRSRITYRVICGLLYLGLSNTDALGADRTEVFVDVLARTFSSAQLSTLVAAAAGRQPAGVDTAPLFEQLQRSLKVERGAAVALLRTFDEQDVQPDRLTTSLAQSAALYHEAADELAGMNLADADSQSLVAQARAALAAGRFGDAETDVGQIEDRELAASQQGVGAAASQRFLDQHQLTAAQARTLLGKIALMKLQYSRATEHFQFARQRIAVALARKSSASDGPVVTPPQNQFVAQEPAKPQEPVVAQEPVKPQEPAKPQEPVVAQEPAKPQEPVAAQEPIKPQEPVVAQEPAKPQEPVVAQETLKPQEPVVAQEPVKPQEPVVAQEPVKQEPVVAQEPVRPQEPAVAQEPVKSQEPVVAQEPVKPQEPVVAQEPVKPQEPVVAQEPVKSQEPVAAQEPVKSQEPVAAQEPVKPQEPVVAQAPGRLAALEPTRIPLTAQEPPRTPAATPQPERDRSMRGPAGSQQAAVDPPQRGIVVERPQTPAQMREATAKPVPVRTMSADMLEMLLRRGDAMLNLGDLASARLLYERAAAAGDGRGATGVGKTYDPRFLAQIGARGIQGDATTAANWYRKAVELGDASAAARLRTLELPSGQ